MTSTATIAKITDHEGHGHCTACQRENLRWIATLTDGTAVGLECAKKAIGHRPAPATYKWVSDFHPIAEHHQPGHAYILWQRTGGTETRITHNARLTDIGGGVQTWTSRGWTL